MKIATSWASASDQTSIEKAYSALEQQLGGTPNYLYLSCSVEDSIEEISRALKKLAPHIPLHGSTSCLGSMTEQGVHNQDGRGIAIFGILDPVGGYGVGAAQIQHDAKTAAKEAVEAALAMADCPGEVPSMVWMTSAPGHEEAAIAGIAEILGDDVPVTGGSSADNTVSGLWKQCVQDRIYTNAVVLTVLFPSTEVIFAFHSGYEPTEQKGVVTKMGTLDNEGNLDESALEGRMVLEIDHRPAMEVYNEWCGGILNDVVSTGGNILTRTTLYPLGRVAGHVGKIPYFQLSHPDSATERGAFTAFSNICVGDELVLMHGTVESLITRAGRVAASTLDTHGIDHKDIAGALVVYCAGCMLTVRERLGEVVDGLKQALPQTPFLGIYTFGEQGCFLGGENRHGNLMISVLLFRKSETTF